MKPVQQPYRDSVMKPADLTENPRGFRVKLYRSMKDSARWFAFGPKIGWVMFPAEVDGWQKRQRARGMAPIDLHEVPIRMGFNTGIPGAPTLAAGASDASLTLVA
jgi:hypothetical protein